MERRRFLQAGLAATGSAVLLTRVGQEANASSITAKAMSSPSDATVIGGIAVQHSERTAAVSEPDQGDHQAAQARGELESPDSQARQKLEFGSIR